MADVQFQPPPGWRTSSDGMAELVQTFDWSGTRLGAPDSWSPSLQLAFDIIMASAFPLALRWGPDFVLIYNDAYRPILGEKHPWAFGRPASEAWSEVWGEIEPAHSAILNGKTPSIFAEDMLLRIQRHGDRWDDARFTLAYSPIKDASAPTGIGGIFVNAVETTDRVATEAALRASEERYELALGASGAIGTWDWDIVGDRVIASPKFAELYSVDPARAGEGAPMSLFFEGVHPDDREAVREAFRRSVEAREDFASEHRLLKADGSTAWVFARGRCHFDEAGEPRRFPGAAVDITERKLVEAELSENRSYLSDILRSSGEAFYAVDREGRTTLCNQAFLRTLGFEREEDAIGHKLHDVIHHTHPDGGRYDKADCPIYQCAATGAPAHVDDESFFHLNGQKIPVEYWVTPVYRDGVHQGAICTFMDITERKATAAALAEINATLERRVAEQSAERDRLWQTSQDLLVVVDEAGIFRAANPAWTSVLGWSPEEVVGQSHLKFVHPDDRPGSEGALDHALNAPLPTYENRCLHKDGGFRWIAWIASSDNSLVYATGRNITAEKEAAAELAVAQEALRQSQKMEAVGQLTGGIAHDFNNMLAVVIGSLDLLDRRLDQGDERARRYVEAAGDGARRAALLTQRLLAFSRQQPLQPEPIDANKLVSGMSDLLRRSIGTDVRLETVLAGGLWRTHADPNQLENVVLNLAVNARDAMPGGGRLTIETQNAHLDERYASKHLGVPPGQYVLVAVSDTGSGMPADVIDKAFDPFFTTKEVGKGTGLGLSQVYGFVKQSGGHVKIYSEVGQGTTIKIYLPRLHGASDTEETTAIAETLAYGDERDVVLVVEDEPAVRQFTVDALHELGYRVLEADGAAVALRLLEANPDIVLLFTDIVMPDVNGAKLADEARRRRPDLKVLFTTGYTRNAVVHNGVLDSGVELIGKPFTLEQLSAKLRYVLEKP
jgi:PAS domain S-box-containing protein